MNEEGDTIVESGDNNTNTHGSRHAVNPRGATTTSSSSNQQQSKPSPHSHHHNPTLDLYGPAYARNWQYWKALLYSSCLQGFVLGALALAFVNYFTALYEATWKTGLYRAALSGSTQHIPNNNASGSNNNDSTSTTSSTMVQPLLLGNGQWWYLPMLMGAGLCVGAIKCVWTYLLPTHPFPDKIPGFIQEIAALQAEDVLLPIPILLASGISIGLGASVGPEAALGASGAAFGTLLRFRWKIGPYQAQAVANTTTYPRDGGGGTHPTASTTEEEGAPPPIAQSNPAILESTMQPPDPPAQEPSSSCLARFFAAVLPDFTDDRLCVIDGMAASFAGLFPAQFLSPLLIHEIGNHWGPGGTLAITETVARSGVAATVSYAFFVTVKGYTILPSLQLPVAFYDVIGEFQLIWVAYALLLGVISGLVGFLGFLSLALFHVLGAKVTASLNTLGDRCGWSGGYIGKLLTPLVGGVLVGALAIAAPLNLGDGSVQLGAVLAYPTELGVGTLVGTAILKLISVGICLGFGFVGGPFFPVIFAGACTGSIMHLVFPDIPLLIAFPCCLVGVPAAILPGMFFLTATASTCMVLGGPATTAVFFTCLVSYSTVCGMGLVQNLLLKAAAQNHQALANESSSGGTNPDKEEDGAESWNPLLQKAWIERPLRSLTSSVGFRTRPDIATASDPHPHRHQNTEPVATTKPPAVEMETIEI